MDAEIMQPAPPWKLDSRLLARLILVAAALTCFAQPSPAVSSSAAAAAAAAPLVNITQIIESAGEFQTFVSLLTATGVDSSFQARAGNRTTTSGITVFAPTDEAFLASSNAVSKLSAQHKIQLLEFHALSAFYPLSALQQVTVPQVPTLATAAAGPAEFTLNVTNADGRVLVSTRLSHATLVSTLYNTVPCGVFAIDRVLLPQEIFGPARSSPVPSYAAPLAGLGPSITPVSSTLVPPTKDHDISPSGQTPDLSNSSALKTRPPFPPTLSASSCRHGRMQSQVLLSFFLATHIPMILWSCRRFV